MKTMTVRSAARDDPVAHAMADACDVNSGLRETAKYQRIFVAVMCPSHLLSRTYLIVISAVAEFVAEF